MFNIASEETYEDGQMIFEEGHSGDWVYVVLSGQVEISKTVGSNKVVIQRLDPEEVFGELGFLGNTTRMASARAVGKTVIGVVDRLFLDKEFNRLSADFREILEVVVNRLRKTVELACRLSTKKG
jgi:CRP-like cAMP-binding protein